MPTSPRLSLKTLRAFVTTVEEGSITGAAARLNIAPSAIASALDQVEAELGAALMVRTRSRGIATKAEGVEIADRFRAVLEEYDTALDAGRALSQSLTGTLRLGYYAPVAPAFLPAVLGPMMTQNQGLVLELHEHDNDSAQDALLSGRLDVALFAGRDVRRGITRQHLLDLPPYILAPEGHDITRHSCAALAQIAQHPLIQLDRPLARPYVDQMFQAAGLSPNITARANSTEMVRSLVGAGAGLAVLAMRPLTAQSYGGDPVCCVPISDKIAPLRLLAGHATRHPRKLVTAFLERLDLYMRSEKAAALTVT